MQIMQSENNEKETQHRDLGEFLNKVSVAKEYFGQHVLWYERIGKEYEKNEIYKDHVNLYDEIKSGKFRSIDALKNYLKNQNISENVLGDVICKIVFEDLDTLYNKKEEYKKINGEEDDKDSCDMKLTSVSISKDVFSDPYWLIDCVLKVI